MHKPNSSPPAPTDDEIDVDIRTELVKAVLQDHQRTAAHEKQSECYDEVDYIWYRNTCVSEVFHVQVFWKVPTEEDKENAIQVRTKFKCKPYVCESEQEDKELLTGAEPEEVEKIEAARKTAEFRDLHAKLTSSSGSSGNASFGGIVIRGGQVNPERPLLEALHNELKWTLSGYSTRPTPEVIDRKKQELACAISDYKQEEDSSMYPYLCDVIFGVPSFQHYTLSCSCPEHAEPKELVWNDFDGQDVSFCENPYPYQFETVAETGTDEIDSCQHWILSNTGFMSTLYLHMPGEDLKDPTDEEINRKLRIELAEEVRKNQHNKVDYIWYRNPCTMSMPELFHVHVFWKVPEDKTVGLGATTTLLQNK